MRLSGERRERPEVQSPEDTQPDAWPWLQQLLMGWAGGCAHESRLRCPCEQRTLVKRQEGVCVRADCSVRVSSARSWKGKRVCALEQTAVSLRTAHARGKAGGPLEREELLPYVDLFSAGQTVNLSLRVKTVAPMSVPWVPPQTLQCSILWTLIAHHSKALWCSRK